MGGSALVAVPSAALNSRCVLAALVAAAVAACFVAAGLWSGDYIRFVAEMVMINAIAAMGVNIGMGFAGLVSVGHAGFAAIGAYATALLMTQCGVPYLVAVLGGGVMAALAGVMIGLPALRLSPLYIAMVTFGFGQAVQYLAINWVELTRGPNGLAVPDATLLGYDLAPRALFFLLIAVFAILFWLSWNVRRTRIGRAFMAVRDSAIAAQSMGIPVARYKTIAFGLSAFYGGVSGGLYAAVSAYVNPDAFTFSVSISYVTMSVIGGLGTLSGPLIGALVLTLLPEFLRSFAEYKEFISGIILLAFLVLMPSGLVGLGRRVPGLLRRAAGR